MSTNVNVLSISLPPGMTRLVDRAARRTHRNRSEFVRHALRDFLERQEEVERFKQAYHATRKQKAYSLKQAKKMLGVV